MFEDIVQMYTYEELVNGRKLTEIINTEHENVKYLPGYKLPENIVSDCLSTIVRISLHCIQIPSKLLEVALYGQ